MTSYLICIYGKCLVHFLGFKTALVSCFIDTSISHWFHVFEIDNHNNFQRIKVNIIITNLWQSLLTISNLYTQFSVIYKVNWLNTPRLSHFIYLFKFCYIRYLGIKRLSISAWSIQSLECVGQSNLSRVFFTSN